MNIATARDMSIEKMAISNYKVAELIGSGGMANIYKAIQLSLDRPVALKIMHQHLSMNEGFVARFEKEAKQAAQLHHENIVSIIDYGKENGDYYIAMEYIDGKNLKQLIDSQRRLPLEICILICHQVAEGLKYAHGQNLVHRDIKPANIILSCDGRVMITDFGIAKGDDDLSITATGQMIGSPAYMSPEQAAGKPTDHRSDIFSLGIILYEILAGEKPFKGDTYQAMVTSIMSQLPVSLQKLRVDVDSEIDEIVGKAIIKDQESRYQSAEEFADALYGQLERFKLPPVKKLISSFLKNPSKMTEKLRTEKISNHMESALYYLNQGEGRLRDAKREFEDVLRFDKNNKSAKKYLERLENQMAVPVSHEVYLPAVKKIRLWHIISGLAILFALFLTVMEIADYGPVKNWGSGSTEMKSFDFKAVTGDGKAGGSKTGETSRKGQSGNLDRMDRTKSTAGKKQVANTKRSSYNYPNQNLKEFGFLTVKTNVPAEVIIDRISYGLGNGPPIKLEPGRHFVEIKANGYRRLTRRIFTEKDKTVDLKVDLVPDR
jgi:serine/threonine protein kinase